MIQWFGKFRRGTCTHRAGTVTDAPAAANTLASGFRRKLDMLHAAHVVGDLRVPPGNRLKALKGNRAGSYSIRVNAQYRVTFRLFVESGNAYEVTCEDYH